VESHPLKNKGELKQAIEESLTQISAQDAHGFYAKSKSYYSICRAGCPFRGNILNPELPNFSYYPCRFSKYKTP